MAELLFRSDELQKFWHECHEKCNSSHKFWDECHEKSNSSHNFSDEYQNQCYEPGRQRNGRSAILETDEDLARIRAIAAARSVTWTEQRKRSTVRPPLTAFSPVAMLHSKTHLLSNAMRQF